MKWWPDEVMFFKRRRRGTFLVPPTNQWDSSFGTDQVTPVSFKSVRGGQELDNGFLVVNAQFVILPENLFDLDEFVPFSVIVKVRGLSSGHSVVAHINAFAGIDFFSSRQRSIQGIFSVDGDYSLTLTNTSTLLINGGADAPRISVDAATDQGVCDSIEVVVPVGTYI